MEKKQVKMSLGTFIVGIIAIILVVVIVIMGIQMSNLNKALEESQIAMANKERELKQEQQKTIEKSNTNNNILNTSNITGTKQDEIIKELDINSDLIQKLYAYIGITSDYHSLSMYREEKITNNNIENKTKLLTALYNLQPEYEEKMKEPIITYNEALVNEGYNDTEESYYSEEPIGIITAKAVENEVKKIFGSTATVQHEDASFVFGEKIAYKDGKYMIIPYEGGGMVPWMDYHQIIKAEQKGNEIYIYDNYIRVISGSKMINESITDIHNVYSTSEEKNKILSYEGAEFYKVTGIPIGAPKENYDEQYSIDVAKWNNLTKSKLPKYMHTFIKGDDGEYYWVSTELTNKNELTTVQ